MLGLYQQGCDTTYKEKVLISTCGGNVPGCFQIVLHPTETTDFHQLYIPTITKQTIKIIIKKNKSFILINMGDVQIEQDGHWSQCTAHPKDKSNHYYKPL